MFFSLFLFFFAQSHVVGQAGRDREMAGKMHHMLALNFPSSLLGPCKQSFTLCPSRGQLLPHKHKNRGGQPQKSWIYFLKKIQKISSLDMRKLNLLVSTVQHTDSPDTWQYIILAYVANHVVTVLLWGLTLGGKLEHKEYFAGFVTLWLELR